MPPINCAFEPGRRLVIVFVLLLLPLITAAALVAQERRPLATPLSTTEKIDITADTLEANTNDRRFIFRGNVKVVQGETVVTSDALYIHYRDDKTTPQTGSEGESGKIEKIEATGNVVILFDGRTAKTDKAVYRSDQEILQLIGDKSTVIDGPNKIVGSKITLYRNEDRIKVESSSKNPADRVKATFFPGGNKTE
ncbi:MAG: LptA/OstA family protein [Desulfobacterales bacterium]|nr:LptA/OstA family protein [Desulfobacterales bacterium]